MSVHKLKKINIEDIKFSKPKNYSNNMGSSINLYYENSSLLIQTPKMMNIFGLNIYKDEKTDKVKSVNITLQFNSLTDKINRVDNFQKKLKKLDNYIIKNFYKNKKEWLKISDKISLEYIDALYKKTLYYSLLSNGEINYSKPPSFKIKVPYYKDKINNVVFLDKNNKKLSYTLEDLSDLIKENVMMKCIINPSIYVVNQNYGVTYNLKAIQILDKFKCEKKNKEKKKSNKTKNIGKYFTNLSSENSESNELENNDNFD